MKIESVKKRHNASISRSTKSPNCERLINLHPISNSPLPFNLIDDLILSLYHSSNKQKIYFWCDWLIECIRFCKLYGNNSIQIAALLIPSIIKFIMEARFNVDSLFTFLQKACASTKAMEATTLPEIAQASANLSLLTKINDKGLLILMLAKIVSEKLVALPRTLTLLLVEMFPVERAPRVRRPHEENGERRRRRRRRDNPQDLDI